MKFLIPANTSSPSRTSYNLLHPRLTTMAFKTGRHQLSPSSIAILAASILGHQLSYHLFCSAQDVTDLSSTANSTTPTSNSTECNCPSGDGELPIPYAVQWVLIVILIMFSAMFSGLTLGLMSLDPAGLEIVMANTDDPKLARAARAIYPIRLQGNLLLCTLLLGNVTVNSGLSIVSATIFSGLVGLLDRLVSSQYLVRSFPKQYVVDMDCKLEKRQSR